MKLWALPILWAFTYQKYWGPNVGYNIIKSFYHESVFCPHYYTNILPSCTCILQESHSTIKTPRKLVWPTISLILPTMVIFSFITFWQLFRESYLYLYFMHICFYIPRFSPRHFDRRNTKCLTLIRPYNLSDKGEDHNWLFTMKTAKPNITAATPPPVRMFAKNNRKKGGCI